MRSSLIGLVFVVASSTLLTGCFSDDNPQQVVSKNNAAFPLGDNGTLYVYFGGEKAEGFWEETIRLANEEELRRLIVLRPKIDLVLDTDGGKYARVSHCYFWDNIVMSFKRINSDFYLVSMSEDGCYDVGIQKPHEIHFVHIKGERFFPTRAEGPDFDEWANRKSQEDKRRLKISSSINVERDGGTGRTKETLYVSVSGVDAYREFFDEFFDLSSFLTSSELFYSTEEPSKEQQELLSIKAAIDKRTKSQQ